MSSKSLHVRHKVVLIQLDASALGAVLSADSSWRRWATRERAFSALHFSRHAVTLRLRLLRPQAAGSRYNKIPFPQNGRLCRVGSHRVRSCAFASVCSIESCFVCFGRVEHFRSEVVFFGRCCARLDSHHGAYHSLSRRHAAILHGGHRRIHRQNIYRSKTATAHRIEEKLP